MKSSANEKDHAQTAPIVSDEELVESYRAGDGLAFERLSRRYRPLLKNRAAQAAGGTLLYDDLLQEGMLGLFKAVQKFEPGKGVPFAAFAKMLVEHQILDAVKHEQREKNRIVSDAVSLQALSEDEYSEQSLTSASAEDVLQKLIVHEHDAALQKSLSDLLSSTELEVINLRMKGFTYEQIAERAGLSNKQVDNSLQRAKRKLKAAAFLV